MKERTLLHNRDNCSYPECQVPDCFFCRVNFLLHGGYSKYSTSSIRILLFRVAVVIQKPSRTIANINMKRTELVIHIVHYIDSPVTEKL